MRSSQTFDDGGFTDAGLADQHRIILRAPGQHLDHAANLIVAADDRIELSLRARSVRSRPYFSRAWYFSSGLGSVNSLRAANADQAR